MTEPTSHSPGSAQVPSLEDASARSEPRAGASVSVEPDPNPFSPFGKGRIEREERRRRLTPQSSLE